MEESGRYRGRDRLMRLMSESFHYRLRVKAMVSFMLFLKLISVIFVRSRAKEGIRKGVTKVILETGTLVSINQLGSRHGSL